MSFTDAVKSMYQNYAYFSGRSSRSAYWWVVLYSIIVVVPLFIIMAIEPVTGFILYFVFAIAHIIPNLALSVRRLHDSGKSGWLYLLVFVPFVGPLILLIFMLLPSSGPNEWGAGPDEAA